MDIQEQVFCSRADTNVLGAPLSFKLPTIIPINILVRIATCIEIIAIPSLMLARLGIGVKNGVWIVIVDDAFTSANRLGAVLILTRSQVGIPQG